jgi:hypothetical protein
MNARNKLTTYNRQKKKDKGQTIILKTLQKKTKDWET